MEDTPKKDKVGDTVADISDVTANVPDAKMNSIIGTLRRNIQEQGKKSA